MGPLLQKPPNMGPLKLIFLIAQARVTVFFDISRSLSDKCFDILWGTIAPRGPQMDPQKSIFVWLNLEHISVFFFLSADVKKMV